MYIKSPQTAPLCQPFDHLLDSTDGQATAPFRTEHGIARGRTFALELAQRTNLDSARRG
jgi:hypothetical protein